MTILFALTSRTVGPSTSQLSLPPTTTSPPVPSPTRRVVIKISHQVYQVYVGGDTPTWGKETCLEREEGTRGPCDANTDRVSRTMKETPSPQ